MAQVLIRDLDPEVLETLKERARRNHRSLQGELKAILEVAARGTAASSVEEFLAQARLIRERTEATYQTDSAVLVREDRER